MLDEPPPGDTDAGEAASSAPASVAPPMCDRLGALPSQQWRSRSAWQLWLAALIVVALAGAVGLVLAAGGRSGGATQGARQPDLSGTWSATGVVLSAHDSAIQTPGEWITRLWLIRNVCRGQACHLQLIREIAGQTADSVGGLLAATLAWSDGKWTATFSEANVYCLTDGPRSVPGREDSTWVLRLAPDGTINATEHTRTSGPHCRTGTTELRWTARRAGTSARVTV